MVLKIPELTGQFEVVSIAKDEKVKNDLIGEPLQFFHITSSSVISFPEKKELKISHETREKILE